MYYIFLRRSPSSFHNVRPNMSSITFHNQLISYEEYDNDGDDDYGGENNKIYISW